MGLKFWKEVGSLPGFGNDRVMIRALSISGGNEAEEAAAWRICYMVNEDKFELFIVFPNKPSGPRALLFGNELMAFPITSFVKVALSLVSWSRDKLGRWRGFGIVFNSNTYW